MELDVLIIHCSPRPDGRSNELAQQTFACIKKQGLQAEMQTLHTYTWPLMASYDEHNLPRTFPPELQTLYDAVLRARSLILISPTHWMGRSALAQQFLDNLTILERGDGMYPLHGKLAGIIVTGSQGGQQSTAAQLATALNHFGYIIPPFCIAWEHQHQEWSQENWMANIPEMLAVEFKRAL